jgi:Heavy metal binding domain
MPWETIITLLVFGAALYFLMGKGGGCCSHAGDSHAESDHARPESAGKVGAEMTYTCPMHPEVRQPRPGTCPKCRMTLKPASPRSVTSNEPLAAGGRHEHH